MTIRYLLDTNVVSEMVKAAANAKVMHWLSTLEVPCLSVVSLTEIVFGIETAPAKRRRGLILWLEDLQESAEFLAVTPEVAGVAGHLRAQSQLQGVTLTLVDSLIAATATVSKKTLATRNVKDFAACKLTLLNPFVEAPASRDKSPY